MEQALRVCVYGATGYTGIELLRYLSQHPYIRVVSLISRTYAGKYLSDVLPYFSNSYLSKIPLTEEPQEDFDLAFLCLPHETSLNLVPELIKKGKKVIDLSGAYRISKKELYPEFYGFEHAHEDTLKLAVYGLSEVFRNSIRNATLVANPGCYPTATLLGLYPFIKEGVKFERVIVDAISGVSGAGRKTAQHFHYPEMEQNIMAYSVDKHRHVPEMEDVIARLSGRTVKIRFTPKVVPASRGMLCSIYLQTSEKGLKELFEETYRGEKFVKILHKPPATKYVIGTNLCFIYPYYDEKNDLAIVISIIDNLGKGASSQAIQNMNIMLGIDEAVSISLPALFP
ncbi:MAG: N-acetyl-gamma-glutamyl-phosphate reductase [Hydrogenobacter sp.]